MKPAAHYDIAQLERLVGVKAHTLRKWEERYQLISPERSAGNIRFYNDAQVIQLLNITLLLSEGFKISQIAAMSSATIRKHVQNIQQHSPESNSGKHTASLHQLLSATLTFDELLFEKTVDLAVKQLGMLRTVRELFYPFFYKIGWMWLSDEVSPAQEHFASNIIRRKLIVASDTLPRPKKKKTFILFLPPGEWHEISLLLADYLVRLKGFKSIYLGQNVPLQNMTKVIETTSPDFVLTLFLSRQNEQTAPDAIRHLAKTYKKPKFLVSSPYMTKDLAGEPKNIKILHSSEDFEKLLEKLT
ncbi:MerR family transcriptional regulator [Cytophaga hutchinsonii]|uniref:Probable transcriptional regulator, MerR family n=1 Tax=Cytophaga hutchinsonii (strain ATCC 33406 / DSM 1761 / CIP 103989 / NBRC 15051 / NCIMB 9469 / D465) TaxID=269798 RepID=A0A6N4SPS3_CYTH3|nr:MerR family transcriptional regulator [Cytophaga hutchinsonii]ABG58337.1 probable transcriptional regulator, MerR family [Cytophaga hutchinsonii ATCC 33406]SFX52281.1 DNA-binding transcriptional regulator, MerR family [Cytophaga hutchinsonii ATCC 33406]